MEDKSPVPLLLQKRSKGMVSVLRILGIYGAVPAGIERGIGQEFRIRGISVTDLVIDMVKIEAFL